MNCDISNNATPRDGNCLLHGNSFSIYIFKVNSFLIVAISDGILENNAFKHIQGESHNETWTQLLLDCQFFDDVDDHTMVL